MSILIKGMQIPKNCKECPLEQIYGRDGEVAKCPLTKKISSSYLASETRMSDCPLVELPSHGRLIDADALVKLLKECDDVLDNSEMPPSLVVVGIINDIKKAPTIIEAEETNK